MTFQLTVNPEAESDLEEARDWYNAQQSGVGDQFIRELRLFLEDVRSMPKNYSAGFRGVRKALHQRFPYIVYYRAFKDRVVVYAVIHASRHSSAWTSRLP